MNEMINAPLTSNRVGTIVKISNLSASDYEKIGGTTGGDATVVTVQELDDTTTDNWLADNQIEEFGLRPILFVGNVVNLTVEHRLGFLDSNTPTEYVDVNGEVKEHRNSRDTVTNASHASTINLAMKGVPASVLADLEARRKGAEESAKPKAQRFHPVKQVTPEAEIDSRIESLRMRLQGAPEKVRAQIQSQIDILLDRKKGKATPADEQKDKVEEQLSAGQQKRKPGLK